MNFIKLTLLLPLIFIISCKKKQIQIENQDYNAQSKLNSTETTTETKFFGDSLKIEYEYRGDTIIQKRIDLKGTSDDNFDSSFTVISIWSTRESSDLKCSDILILDVDEIEFKFCYLEIFNKLDEDIKKANKNNESWQVDDLTKKKNTLKRYKNNKQEDLNRIKEYFLFDLLREINFSVYHKKTKSEVKSVRIEKYETSFSGGRNYYLINKTRDTIARIKRTEWMR